MQTIIEQPYAGRATVDEWIDKTIIIIPAERPYFKIIFLAITLCFWLLTELTMAAFLTDAFMISGFEIFVEVLWAIIGFFMVRDFTWAIAGKEVVTVNRDYITIENKYLLFNKPKTYLLQEVKNMSIMEETPGFISFTLWRHRTRSSPTNGTIWFDYGMKPVGFAAGINDLEARHIIEKLRNKKLLTDENF